MITNSQLTVSDAAAELEVRFERMGAPELFPLHEEAVNEIKNAIHGLDPQRAKPVFDALAQLAVHSFQLGKEYQRSNSFAEVEGWFH